MNQPFDTIRVSLEEVHNISNQNISPVSEQIVSLQQDSVVMKPVAEVTPVAEIKTEPEITPIVETQEEPEIIPVAEVKTEQEVIPVAEVKTEQEVTEVTEQETNSEESILEELPEAKIVEQLPEIIDEPIQLQVGRHPINYNIKITNKGKLLLFPGTIIGFDQCGIFCQGTIDAKEVVFTTTKSGWDNITFDSKDAFGNFDSCVFERALGKEVSITNQCEYTNANMCIGGPLLFANNAKGTLKECTIGHNSSLSAIALVYAGEVSIVKTRLIDNKNTGIFAVASNFNLEDSQVYTVNRTARAYGIMCRKNTQCVIENTLIGGNYIGLEMQDNAKCNLKNVSFINNNTSCLCKNNSNATITNCRFSQEESREIISRDKAKIERHQNNFRDSFDELRNAGNR